MSILQDPTFLSPAQFGWSLSSREAQKNKDGMSSKLKYRGSLSALSSLVRDPLGTLAQGWDGLSKEERAERVRTQARKQLLYMQLREAITYDAWRNAAVELDDLEGYNAWKQETESPDYDPEEIRMRLEQLDMARIGCDARRMLFLIRTSLTRNLGNMGNVRLYSRSFIGTKDLIERYIESALSTLNTLLEMSAQGLADDLRPKDMLDQVLAARQAFGRSALLLSGGANFGMNHIGVLKALWENKLLPRIISGASAGSIVCSVLCTHTDEEIPSILDNFCQGNLAVFEEQGSEGSILNKITRFLKYGSLFDISLLTGVLRDMIGDLTFQEAYNRTRRILNICVSSASLYELPRLLNYITAPNVLIWSAVAASCSVPLVFTSASLLAKDVVTGAHVPWNASPQKWIDGSVDGDLPMTRLAEMFNVNHFIVSQVNPHVVPFIAKEEQVDTRSEADSSTGLGSSTAPSWLHTISCLAKSEAIYRMHTLIDFGLFPNTLTKTISVLSQKYSGDITILPEISYTDFPTMMSNPTPEFLQKSMLRGERATWPKFSRIRNHVAIELALDDAVQQLRTRVVFSSSQADLRLSAYPKTRPDAARSQRGGVSRGTQRHQHRRPSHSSELDASAAARLLKTNSNRSSLDSTHAGKARSVNLPWISHGGSPSMGTAFPAIATNLSAAPLLPDILSSGAETSNIYTSDSLADQSSSESPTSPSSPADEPGWDETNARWSYSVPVTPAMHRQQGPYVSQTGSKTPGPSAARAPSTTTVPSQPSAQEAKYKRLFHSKGGAAARMGESRVRRQQQQQSSSVEAQEQITQGQEQKPHSPNQGVKRFNALGLEIDLSGAKGVIRKKTAGPERSERR